MANQKRKNTKGIPVTAHPLFPAVVALWFGSLFGLGSLAIRPGLLESVVVSAGIDLVVPAASPPLGVTARILLALTLAAIGATLGAVVGRWIARPRPVVRPRRRGAGTVESDESGETARYNDNPVFAAASTTDADEGVLAGRRRSLAIDHEEDDFVPYDSAPLPGGVLQVFDIAGLQLGGLEASEQADGNPEPLDLGSFADSPPPGPGAVELDWNATDPAVARIALASDHAIGQPDQRQTFAPFEPADHVDSFHAPHDAAPDNRQIFGQPVPAGTAEGNAVSAAKPRQIFGVAVEGDHVPQDFVKAAGFKTSVFEPEEHAPLFPQRVQADAMPPASQEPGAISAAEADHSDPVRQAVAATPMADEMPASVSAETDDADIGSLGMTDLAQRLAQSMERRRAARAAAAVLPPEPAPVLPNAAEGIGALSGAEVLASVPAPFAASAPVAPVAAEAGLAVEAGIAAAEHAAKISTVQPSAHPHPALSETLTPDASPAFPAPAGPETHIPAAPLAMPAALRPLSFDDTPSDDLEFENLLPPRRIAMPSATGFDALAMDQEAVDEVAAEALEPEEDPASAGAAFGSLIDLGANRRTSFVRIEEPEAPTGAVEPVVIFPGQAPVTPLAAPHAAPTEAEASQFRRFDAPASAGQGQPVEVSGLESALDPAEAERSLRSALANLQRMSGAA